MRFGQADQRVDGSASSQPTLLVAAAQLVGEDVEALHVQELKDFIFSQVGESCTHHLCCLLDGVSRGDDRISTKRFGGVRVVPHGHPMVVEGRLRVRVRKRFRERGRVRGVVVVVVLE